MTDDADDFWASIRRAAAVTRTWPDWMFAGIVLNPHNFTTWHDQPMNVLAPWFTAEPLYPWVYSVMPAFEENFGRPKGLLGSGMFGQVFDLGGPVVKVTISKEEVSAVSMVLNLRRNGQELRGLCYLAYSDPVALGHVRGPDGEAVAYAIVKERVAPIDASAINRAVKTPRRKLRSYERAEELDTSDRGTMFEFASEAAQDCVEATGKRKAALLREYGRWVNEIAKVDGFEDVAESMDTFLEKTGTPLWDVRPENCGRILRGDKHIVCFDFELPAPRKMQHRRQVPRPKA